MSCLGPKMSSLNLIITSLVGRQDHNGFTHQDPGFLDVVTNKRPNVVRIYLPPDANFLLSIADHCPRSVNYANVIIAGKQAHLQDLDIHAPIEQRIKGASIWSWASSDQDAEPDAVMASCGDCPTVESQAATALLCEHLPDLQQADRFGLASDAIDRMPRFRVTGSTVREALLNQQIACRNHAYQFRLDAPEITNWKWPFQRSEAIV
jgi:phosphoketolase